MRNRILRALILGSPKDLRFGPLCLVAIVAWPAGSGAETIRVPADQPTIQAAIDVAATDDLVLVSAGTFPESIDFLGKAITVRSESGPAVTIIDPGALPFRPDRSSHRFERRTLADGTVEVTEAVSGRRILDAEGLLVDELPETVGNNGSVVVFGSRETRDSVLDGFTITGGDATTGGGGIRIDGASPTVINNIIDNNRACSEGGGIAAAFASPRIENNQITNNFQDGCSGGVGGGGIALRGAGSAEVIGNTIAGNSFGFGGGLSLFAAGTPTIADNWIEGNTGTLGGGGFDIVNVSDALIVQNVVIDNTGSQGSGDGFDWLVPSSGRGPILLVNTITGNGQLELFVDGFDEDAELVDNIVVAAPGGTGIECGDFNDLNPPVLRFNNVFAPGGAAYAGICGDPTGSDGNLSADPLFANPAAADLRLSANSPSVDAGDDSVADLPATDFDGNPRIQDGNGDQLAVLDQGAFERIDPQPVFADGFESGDFSEWSSSQP